MKAKMKAALSIFVTMALMLALTAMPMGALAAVNAYAATPVEASGARARNIQRTATAINGYVLTDGAQFSFNHVVGERSKERGYESALNGRGVKNYGGGSAQVASTLYLAIKNTKGIYIDELSTYGDRYSGDYVRSGRDAVTVDWKTGSDFSFTNNTGKTLRINAWLDDGEVRVSLDEDADIIGYGTTNIYGGSNKYSNIERAAKAIDGLTLSRNDIFSFNDLVGPRTAAKGYKRAINGRGVKVTGGGVAQVASAVWLAVKDMDDIEIIDKHTYGKRYSERYVDDADDAIVTDYSAGTDFSFRYRGRKDITLYCYVAQNSLICEIYG